MVSTEGSLPLRTARRKSHQTPEIVEAIMEGRQDPEITLARPLEPFPVEWTLQSAFFSAERH